MTQKVFQSNSPRRWKSFQWAYRILAFTLIICSAFVFVSLYKNAYVFLPKVADENEVYKKITNPDHPLTLSYTQNRDYRELREKISTGGVSFHYCTQKENLPATKLPLPKTSIRAGFYVNWDLQSYYSLKNNIKSLNMVIPEWLFVADSSDEVQPNIDSDALTLMRNNHVPIVPIISNYYNEKWNGDNVHRIISTEANRQKFIGSVLSVLDKNKFAGVNIDFEELNEKTDANLIAFQKELYDALHKKGYIVTQDVEPLNSDYNLTELNKYNDYLFVMAYDQHYPESVPGPVAAQDWINAILQQTTSKIPADKVILCVAGYGYDWPQGSEGIEVTYEQAVSNAKTRSAKVTYLPDSNLTYQYTDDFNVRHTVYCTDAAADFNAMRAAEDFNLSGVALWRLGSEDPRLWKFYNKNLDYDSVVLDKTFVSDIQNIKALNNIDFMGEGEVLNVISTPEAGYINVSTDSKSKLISAESYINLPTSYVVKKMGQPRQKEMVLSFDDGPDETYTPQILDILKKENVPATFFMIGENAENNIPLVTRIYNDGYEIGNHTFTHPNLAEVATDRAAIELLATRRLIECITGHSTVLFRPPYNADAEPSTLDEMIPVALGKSENYYTVGESIDPLDWQKGVKADTILARVISQTSNGSIILLHDAGGDRSETVKALPAIIHYYKSRGYKFTTVSELIGKKRDDVMPPLKSKTDVYLSYVNLFNAELIYNVSHIIFGIFFISIILMIIRMISITILANMQRKRSKNDLLNYPPFHERVSVIVPAYNEELNAVKTVNNLLKSTYQNLDIIFVDDGSTDDTYEKVRKAFDGNTRVKVFTKPNGGKSTALNFGIARAEGDFIVGIDSDTLLKTDAIEKLVRYFNDEKVAAVAGNVKVGNESTVITRWQSIEYISSQNFDKRAFALLNCITVVPGAIGAFRKSVVQEVGGLTDDTLAEDCDLTIRILRAGYVVKYCSEAIAITEAPETTSMFMKQRFRWTFGIMQSFWKHREVCFNASYKALGLIALPNILVFQVIIPLLAPIADVLMLFEILTGHAGKIALYYIAFLIVESVGAIVAFSFEGEDIRKLWLLIPQRLIYRYFIWWALIKAILKAIKGELISWGRLIRTGSVKEMEG